MKRGPRWKRPLSWVLFVTALGQAVAWAGTGGTETYTYDALGRLWTVLSSDGTQATYQYDAAGNRSAVNSGADVTAPTTPTGLTATAASASQINLNWNASTDSGGSGLKGYKITRNGSALVTTTTTATTYSDTGLTASTTYTYTVAGYDNAGNTSAASTGASATTSIGTFLFVSGSHTAAGSSNDIATATIKNTGNGSITGISCTCSSYSFHNYGTCTVTLAPAASANYQCQSAASGGYTATIQLTGAGASNSPFSVTW
jgi:YD repeat-containing protein